MGKRRKVPSPTLEETADVRRRDGEITHWESVVGEVNSANLFRNDSIELQPTVLGGHLLLGMTSLYQQVSYICDMCWFTEKKRRRPSLLFLFYMKSHNIDPL